MDDLIAHPLVYARRLRGISQADLVRGMRAEARRMGLRTGVDKPAISRWEHEIKAPDYHSQLLIARVLGVRDTDLDELSWPDWLPGQDQPLPLGPDNTVRALRSAQKDAMDRRSFMSLSAPALTALAAQWAASDAGHLQAALDRRVRVDPALIDFLETSSAQLNALPTEQRQHAARLLDAQRDTVIDLIAHGAYGQALGRRLHLLAASLSTTCGWHRFDQEQHYAASKLWVGALHAATAAGDRDFGAGVLSDFGYQSLWTGRPHIAVDHLEHALANTGNFTARSLLHLRRARAHAALGNRRETHADLKAAEHALNRAAGTPSPAWCAWMSPADLAVDTGQALSDLGDTHEAATRITEGIKLLPPARNKTRGVFLASQARTALDGGDVEQAAHLAVQSLDIAERIGADRCVRQVRALLPRFTRHPSATGVEGLVQRLRTA